MKRFSAEEAIKIFNAHTKQDYEQGIVRDKPFYSFDEWEGWPFYRKAIRYRDWRSLWGHIKSHFSHFA